MEHGQGVLHRRPGPSLPPSRLSPRKSCTADLQAETLHLRDRCQPGCRVQPCPSLAPVSRFVMLARSMCTAIPPRDSHPAMGTKLSLQRSHMLVRTQREDRTQPTCVCAPLRHLYQPANGVRSCRLRRSCLVLTLPYSCLLQGSSGADAGVPRSVGLHCNSLHCARRQRGAGRRW